MDMSVKLNTPYQAVPASGQPVDRSLNTGNTQDSSVPGFKKTDASTDTKSDADADSGATQAEKIQAAIKALEKYVQSTQRNLQFSTDEDTGRIVVKVIAVDTGELVRQIPSEEALRLAKSLSDVNSVLFDAKA